MLREQLAYEDHLRKNFEKINEDINNIFDLRKNEKSDPKLKFSIFDPLRNGAARAIRMKQVGTALIYNNLMTEIVFLLV